MARIVHSKTSAQARKARVRADMVGTAERPRVSVQRSNRFMYVQAIDDTAGVTIAAARSSTSKGTKTEQATAVGTELAKALQKKSISAAIFDRGQYKYHGRVRAVAEALRAADIAV